MKTKFKNILLTIAVMAFAFSAEAYQTLVNGYAWTTNTVLVGSTLYQNGVVLAASTNTFNLSGSTGSQLNTNLWPAAAQSIQGGYPSTLNGPARYEGIYLYATNTAGTATTYTVNFGGSVDGASPYVTNILSLTATCGVPLYTNWDSGALPILNLQSVGNTNGAAALTNIVIQVTDKPGL